MKNSSEESNETSEESNHKSEEFAHFQVANQKYLRRNLGNSQVENETSSFLSCVSPADKLSLYSWRRSLGKSVFLLEKLLSSVGALSE